MHTLPSNNIIWKTVCRLLHRFSIFQVPNIVEYKGGHLTGLIGDIVTYMEEFLKFKYVCLTFAWKTLCEQSYMLLNLRTNRTDLRDHVFREKHGVQEKFLVGIYIPFDYNLYEKCKLKKHDS